MVVAKTLFTIPGLVDTQLSSVCFSLTTVLYAEDYFFMSPLTEQLSLNVFLRDQLTFQNFYAEENSAELAKENLIRLSTAQTNENVLLWGRPGCGLTHLLQACCHRAFEQGIDVQYLPLGDFIEHPSEQVLSGLADQKILCLDDIDTCAGNPDWERGLFNLFNELKAKGHSLVTTMHVSPREFGIELPDLRSRLMSAPAFHLPELSDEAKLTALVARAKNAAMELPLEVANFILTRVSRRTKDLFNMLDRLEAASLSRQRKLTIPFVKEELNIK